VREGVVTKSDLETFDEVFLTNAMVGIKWVAQSKKKKYINTQTLKIYKDIVSPLFS
jgi:branched-subunit amino acid aminotransferase/4-amino-4-deoxychorismate lyase